MKKKLSFQGLFIACTIASGLLSSCNEDVLVVDQPTQTSNAITRASEFHWRCIDPICNFSLNGGWRNFCSACGADYNPIHGNLILSFSDVIMKPVGSTNIPPTSSDGGGRIELPNKLFMTYAPPPWYENSTSLKYYNDLKTMYYYATPDYAEGVDFAWYRTVRILYPKIANVATIENLFDKFLVNEGRDLRGPNGTGIKDGSKAAVKAFAAYR